MIEPKDQQYPESFTLPPPPWKQNINKMGANIPPVPLASAVPPGMPYGGSSLPGIGELLSQTWRIFISNIGTYIGIAVLPIIAQIIAMVVVFFVFLGGVVSMFSRFSAISKATSVSSLILIVIIGLVLIVLNVLSQTALICAAVRRDRKVGIGEAFNLAISKIHSFLWIGILSIIIIGGGFFLFVIPGILFTIWFIFASYVLMSEDARGMTAILKSREYVKGKGFSVFLYFLAFTIILGIGFFAVYLGFFIIGGIVSAAVKSSIITLIFSLVAFVAPFLFQPVAMALNAIFSALIYEHLKISRGAVAYAPTTSQKAVYLGIGLLGWALPAFAWAQIFGFLFSQAVKFTAPDRFPRRQNKFNEFLKESNVNSSYNFQYKINTNFNSNINGGNQQNVNSSSDNKDLDNDGLSDSAEKSFGTNPSLADTDFDGLTDGAEVSMGTKPTNPDTDGDGFKDGEEARNGYDPLGSGKTQ